MHRFFSGEDSEVLKADVHGVILGVPWPFELPNSDGCVDSGITCPIKAGQTYKYVTTLPIKSEYPRVTVDIKWELKNKDDKDIICAMIPSKIG
ncbi:hypothetical protein NQ317_014586 [Molorchus minor]|uniref:MD-2-related lipid-recognition domain-containing protein n=1 Tax=Molorchus minor TaxID=1323400 RepID=A0ABQ9K1J3_9CUCU|nr:hypothetical protein NQ317_014586 [Molorchus minor]